MQTFRAFAVRRTVPLLFLAVFTLALLARLPFLERHAFGGDESRDFARAARLVSHGELPAFGSELFDGPARLYGPAFYWMLAPPLFIERTVEAVVLWQALLAALACAVTFLFLRRLFGTAVGALAALLYAASPWAVFQSTGVWNPYFSPILAAAFGWCLARWAADRKPGWFVPLPFLVAGLVSLNLGNGYFAVLLGAAWWILKPPTGWRVVAASAALALVPFLPSLVSEFSTGFANLSAILAAQGARPFRPEFLKVFSWGVLAFTNEVSQFIGRGAKEILSFYDFPSLKGIVLLSANLVTLVAVPWAYGRFVRRARRDRQAAGSWRAWALARPGHCLVALWLLSPVLWFVLLRQPVEPRYLVGLFPAGFAIVALLLVTLWTEGGARTRRAVLGLGAFVFVAMLWLGQAYAAWIDARDFRWRLTREAWDQAAAKSGERPFRIAAEGKNPWTVLRLGAYPGAGRWRDDAGLAYEVRFTAGAGQTPATVTVTERRAR